jgi:hypothetical protein
MNEQELLARAKQMRAAVLEQLPEARPLIADLVQEGLIDGWRNVVYVGPPREVRGITAAEYLQNSKPLRGQYGTAAETV